MRAFDFYAAKDSSEAVALLDEKAGKQGGGAPPKTTRKIPAKRSGAPRAKPPIDIAPAPCAAETSSGVSPTTYTSSASIVLRCIHPARSIARRVRSDE